MRKFVRATAWLLTVALMLGLAPGAMAAPAEETAPPEASGDTNMPEDESDLIPWSERDHDKKVASGKSRGVDWELYDDGTLYIIHNGSEELSHTMGKATGTDWNEGSKAEWAKYAEEYGPFNAVIQPGFENVGKGVFVYDETVQSVLIPSSVTKIDEQAFDRNTSLKRVIWGGTRNGKSSLELGKMAFFGTSLEAFTLPEGCYRYVLGQQCYDNILTLSEVVLPSGTIMQNYPFLHTPLKKLTISEGVRSWDQQTDNTINYTYAFSESFINELVVNDNITLISGDNYCWNIIANSDMNVVASPGTSAEAFAKENFLYFNGEFTGMDISVNVKDFMGQVMDAGTYRVDWYYEGGSEVAGTGSIYHVTDSTRNMECVVRVTEDEAIYDNLDSDRIRFDIGARDHAKDVQLNGRASASLNATLVGDGNVTLLNGTYTLTQYYGSKSKFYEGQFRISNSGTTINVDNLRALDTDLMINAEGYLPKSVHLSVADLVDSGYNLKSWNLGTIDLYSTTPKSGSITLNAILREPAKPGETGAIAGTLSGFDGVTITIKRDGQTLDFTASYPLVTFAPGTVAAGDTLDVWVETGDGLDGEGTVTLDSDCSGVLDIDILKPGRIAAFPVIASGDVTAMLFEGGRLISSENVGGQYMSDYLDDGEYALVLIEKNSLLGSVSELSQLTDIGLKDGADYVSRTVNVSRGVLTDLDVLNVPEFDELKYSCIDPAMSGVTPGYTEISQGQAINVRAEYAVTADHLSPAKHLLISLPEGTAIRSGSLTVNGAVTAPSGETGGVTVAVPSDAGVVRFQLTARTAGHYEVTVYLTFEEGGVQVMQPIGTSVFDAESITVNAPSITSRNKITVNGRAVAEATVDVFDNGLKVGTASTNHMGDWTLTYDLQNGERPLVLHEVTAQLISTDAALNGIKSAPVTVEYNAKYPDVDRVEVVGTGVTFDYNNPNRVQQLVVESTQFSTYTYKIYFNRDADKVTDVILNVFNNDRTVSQAPAVYNAEDGCFVASAASLPVNVGVEYNFPVQWEEDEFGTRLDYAKQITEAVKDCADELDDLELHTVGQSITEDTDPESYEQYEHVSFTATDVNGEEAPFATIYFEHLNYEDYKDVTENGGEYRKESDDEGEYYVKLIISDVDSEGRGEIAQIVVDHEEKTAVKLSFPYQFMAVDLENALENNLGPAAIALSNSLPVTGAAEAGAGTLAAGRASSMDNFIYGRAVLDTVETFAPFIGPLSGLVLELPAMINLQRAYERMAYTELYYAQLDLTAICSSTGQPKVPQYMIYDFTTELSKINSDLSFHRARFDKAFNVYSWRIANAFAFGAVTSYIGKALKSAAEASNAKLSVLKAFNRAAGDPFTEIWIPRATAEAKSAERAVRLWTTAEKTYDFLGYMEAIGGNIASVVSGEGVELPQKVGGIWDFNDVCAGPYYLNILETYNIDTGIIGRILRLDQQIKDAYHCDKKPDPPKDPAKSPCSNNLVTIDPSGWVCEAVPSNRLPGVTATAYMVDADAQTLWQAGEYSQVNPLTTDSEGRYSWFVPEGNWQVRFEKDGYETTWSDVVPVPPVQTEVNVSMTSTAAPGVKETYAYAGFVYVEFTQYMAPDSVNITVEIDGEAVDGRLEPINAEGSFDDSSVMLASKYRFVPETALEAGGTVSVTVVSAVSYNGKSITGASIGDLTVLVTPTSIIAPEVQAVQYGEEDEIIIRVGPRDETQGLEVRGLGTSGDILTLASPATVDGEGKAYIKVKGLLPGELDVTFTIPGTQLTASTHVIVSTDANSLRCAEVTASPAPGTVVSGTSVTLATATEGAQIWYTTDGTCPCNLSSPSRTLYTGPISLTQDTTIIAYAVKDGYEDSEKATFKYTVTTPAPAPGGQVTPPPPAQSQEWVNPFTDVYSSNWFYDDVASVASAGLMTGKSATVFAPHDQLTRGEITAILWRYAGAPKAGKAVTYSDVPEGAWYADALSWAAEAGVALGVGGGRFAPSAPVTRQQLAAMLYRYAKLIDGAPAPQGGALDGFPDAKDVSSWAREAMEWCVERGIIRGADGLLLPGSSCQRCQAAAMINRFTAI